MRGRAERITHIFCDIDGTLLNSRHEVTPETRRVLSALKHKGIEVILISARPPRAMADLRRESGASDTMICCAGAAVCRGTDIISSLQIPLSALQKVLDHTRGTALSLNLYRHWDWYVEKNGRWPRAEAAIVGFVPTVTSFPALLSQWEKAGEGPNKMLLMGDAEQIGALTPTLKAAVGEDAQPMLSKPTYLEFLPPHVDKGTALAAYCARHRIPIAHTLSCGDQDVDIPLLKASGLSIAMGNGSEGAKAAARLLAPSNDEDGLARALEALLL